MKYCVKCRKVKPVGDFCKNSRCRDGLTSWCKQCHRDYNKIHYRNNSGRCKEWREENRFLFALIQSKKSAKRNGHVQCVSSVEELAKSFNGACAICGEKEGSRKLHMDHNHETGKFRSFLCNRCNRVLGAVHDSKSILESMVEYLNKYRE